MYKTIDYPDFEGNYVLVDVRSPGEFKEATIPGAVNVPLFEDEDRKNIGYVYVNESVEKAKKLGIEAVSKRLPEIYDDIWKLNKDHDRLILFCAKGGMRSTSLYSLFGSLGLNVYKLKGGYKAYRQYINENLPKICEGVKFIVLHGNTGVGKTDILSCLKEKGCNVLDLESAANHRGSLLGDVGLGSGRSQKAFESLVYESLKTRNGNFVFVEAESKRIGNIIIPDYIHKSMEKGYHIFVDADLDFRAEVITKEYTKGQNCQQEILSALDKLSKYINAENISRYRTLVMESRFAEVAKELMEKYYDPMYMNKAKKYEYDLTINIESIEQGCIEIMCWFEKMEKQTETN